MIQIKNVSKKYHTKVAEVEALKNVNLTIEDGEIFGIIGYSGSGKSTLIRCINQLERVDSGQILIDGSDMTRLSEKELRKKRQKISMIFQHFNLLKNDTVYQNVARPLLYLGINKQEVEERVDRLLELVGLADKKKNYPSQLSGGQKQRVAIARALATNPEILLCDEATSALDPDTTSSILALLKKLNQKLGLTLIMVTHQMEVVKEICDKVAVLSKGEIVEQGKTLDVFVNSENPITRQFSNSLFQADKIQDILANEKIQQSLQDGGIVTRLLFVGESANEAVLSEVSKKYDIEGNIIFGNIIIFQEEPVGNLYVVFRGKEENIALALKYIEKQKVIINQIELSFEKGGIR